MRLNEKIHLEKVEPNKEQIIELYSLLETRKYNISHQTLPLFDEHSKFVTNHPYRSWYLVKNNDESVGSFYLNQDNTIGINLIEFDAEVVHIILDYIYSFYKPLPGEKSVRSSVFSLHVAPENKPLQRALEEYHMEIIQFTYQLPVNAS